MSPALQVSWGSVEMEEDMRVYRQCSRLWPGWGQARQVHELGVWTSRPDVRPGRTLGFPITQTGLEISASDLGK